MDEVGASHVYVKGPVKVMSHLMFGALALSADQLMRLLLPSPFARYRGLLQGAPESTQATTP